MKRLTDNIPIKLLSLGIGIILWVFITNTVNPVVSGFVSVPVTIENEDYILSQNKTYIVIDSRVIKVTYKVKSDLQTRIRQSDFKVYVDLKDLDTTNLLPIHVNVLSNDVEGYISNVLPEPQVLHVELDDMLRREFEVHYDIRGDIGGAHSVGSVILSPNIVYVSGSNTAVDNIEHVSIEIPLNEREESFSGVAKVRLFDANGAPIPPGGLELSAEEINYSVVINSKSNVNLNVVSEGTVAPGFVLLGMQAIPDKVLISGPGSVVRNMYVQDIPVNIDGIYQNTEYTIKLSNVLPKGITSNVDSVKVNVAVAIDPNANFGSEDGKKENMSEIITMPTSREETDESQTVEDTESIEGTDGSEETESAEIIETVKPIESTGIIGATKSQIR